MSEFAQKQNQPKISHLVSPVKPDQSRSRSPENESQLLAPQQALGNQAMQRFAQSSPLALLGQGLFPTGGAYHTCPPKVQAKLEIGQPNDKYEQEADRVAEKIIRMPDAQLSKQPEKETQITLRANDPSSTHSEVTPELELRIQSLEGGGQPLPESVRSFFEPRFEYDFRNVCIHTGDQAAETAQALNARAFTIGQDIIFGERQYRPETKEGRTLLAHELTHAVQQSVSDVPVLQREQLSSVSREEGLPFAEEPMSKMEGNPGESPEVCISGPSIEKRADLLYTILDAAHHDLLDHASKWEAAAETFGKCYYNAYKTHEDTVHKQEKHVPLVKEIAFFIIEMVTQGAISAFSTHLQRKEELEAQKKESPQNRPGWLVNSFEDIAQVTFGKILPSLKENKPIGPVLKDPLYYYMQIKGLMANHFSNSSDFINNYVQWAKDVKIDVYMGRSEKHLFLESFDADDFDYKVNMWKAGLNLFNDPPSIPEKDLTEQLEIGIWAKWVVTTLDKRQNPTSPIPEVYKSKKRSEPIFGYTYSPPFIKPGGIVETRLCTLKINNVCNFGTITKEYEIVELVEWGKKWKPTYKFEI